MPLSSTCFSRQLQPASVQSAGYSRENTRSFSFPAKQDEGNVTKKPAWKFQEVRCGWVCRGAAGCSPAGGPAPPSAPAAPSPARGALNTPQSAGYTPPSRDTSEEDAEGTKAKHRLLGPLGGTLPGTRGRGHRRAARLPTWAEAGPR